MNMNHVSHLRHDGNRHHPPATACGSRKSKHQHHVRFNGITLLEVIGLILIAGMVLALLLPNVRHSREAARRMACANQFKRIGLALHNYHFAHKQLPAAMGGTSSRQQGASNARRLSGLVSLLPYLEQQMLWEQIAQADEYPAMGPEPWDSEYAPWRQQIAIYQCSTAEPPKGKFGFTNYTFCIGDVAKNIHEPHSVRGAFACGRNTRFAEIRDGLATTIAMAEIGTRSNRSIPGQFVTGQPSSFLRDPGSAESLCEESNYVSGLDLSNLGRGGCWADGAAGFSLFNTILPPNSPSLAVGGSEAVDGIYSAGSFHPGGGYVLMADGAVIFMTQSVEAGDPHHPSPNLDDFESNFPKSPYGLWGALGTASAEDSIPDDLDL